MFGERCVIYLQTNFHGVTGLVAFDRNGFRKDFKLNVLELNLNKPARKVRLTAKTWH